MRIRSSSSDRKKRDRPGSPCRPDRPRNWLSMRRLSWRSVPITNSPPACFTFSCAAAISVADLRLARGAQASDPSMPASSFFSRISRLPPSLMSVPRPAMLVAMVTAPGAPACATISASCSWKRAFSTACGTFFFFSSSLIVSLFSIEVVPTSTGCPRLAGLLDQRRDRLVFLVRGAIDLVVLVVADARHVGRDLHHVQLVDLGELVGLGHRRAGHAGQLGIQPEVVLEGDRGERLVLRLDRRRVPSPPAPGAARRSSAGPPSCGR